MDSINSATERVCYVHCNSCNTILAVSVPCSSMFTIVTVRCGHCANLLSVNMGGAGAGASLQPAAAALSASHHHYQGFLQGQLQKNSQLNDDHDRMGNKKLGNITGGGSSSTYYSELSSLRFPDSGEPPRTPPIRPPEKQHRVPSAYNKFIKEEIQRIKTSKPDISHREAFSMAAKNWAHFPRIYFGGF